MRRLQGRGVSLLCPPQGDKGNCCQVPCLQGRLSLERLHYRGRLPGDYGQDARPSFERRPSCIQEVLCQGAWNLQGRRGQTWCVPLPAEQVPFQQRRPRQTDHSQLKGCVSPAKPSAFVVSAYNQRRFNKTGLGDYRIFLAIILPYSMSQYYARSCSSGTRTKAERVWGPLLDSAMRRAPEVLGLWLDGNYSELPTDQYRTTDQSNDKQNNYHNHNLCLFLAAICLHD